MENLRKKFLLGVNKEENKIYFGEIEITTRNGYKEFTANFDVGEAFDVEDIDENYAGEYMQNYWNCLDAETKIKYLEDGEITKEDLFENWEIEADDYREYKDCSCTDFETELNNGQTINFESTCGGQYDIRENQEEYNNIIFTNKKAVELILDLWDEYHLKNIEKKQEEIKNKIDYILEKLNKYNCREYENIEDFIKANIEEV